MKMLAAPYILPSIVMHLGSTTLLSPYTYQKCNVKKVYKCEQKENINNIINIHIQLNPHNKL